MTDFFEFDLFHFYTLTGKTSRNVSLKSCMKLKQVLLLKTSFFKEDILSSISPPSNLHETYCSNSTPSEILLAREDLSSTKVNRPILSNGHSFFTIMTTLYDPSKTIYQVWSSCTWHLFTLFKKENNEYTTLGWSSYQCDPTFELLIIFVFVKP